LFARYCTANTSLVPQTVAVASSCVHTQTFLSPHPPPPSVSFLTACKTSFTRHQITKYQHIEEIKFQSFTIHINKHNRCERVQFKKIAVLAYGKKYCVNSSHNTSDHSIMSLTCLAIHLLTLPALAVPGTAAHQAVNRHQPGFTSCRPTNLE